MFCCTRGVGRMVEVTYRYLIHVSDIHIQWSRRAEYVVVFRRLIDLVTEKVKTLSAAPGDVALVITGDIFHHKDKYQAEELRDAFTLFDYLAAICPIVVIAGNHDANLKRIDRVDLILPIAERYKGRVHYLRESGVHALGGVNFYVLSRLAPMEPGDLAGREPVVATGPRVALLHDQVNGAQYENGVRINNGIDMNFINGFDMVLAGDIHKRQVFGERRHAAYAGSLFQQTIDEELAKGFLVWDLQKKCDPEFVRVPNDQGFMKLRVRDGAWVRDGMPSGGLIPPVVTKCVIDYSGSGLDRARLLDELQKMYPGVKFSGFSLRNLDNKIVPVEEGEAEATVEEAGFALDATAVEHVREFFARLGKDEKQITEMIRLHRRYIASLGDNGATSAVGVGARWRLLRMEWSDVTCYGKGNVIDFTKIPAGVVSGILAENMMGKTSVLDALLVALYNEKPRGAVRDIINYESICCDIRVDFEVGGDMYVLRRRVDRFNSNEISLTRNGERFEASTIDATYRIMRDIIGTYEDLSKTALIRQDPGARAADFVYSKEDNHKEILGPLFSLDVYDEIGKLRRRHQYDLETALELQLMGTTSGRHNDEQRKLVMDAYYKLDAQIRAAEKIISDFEKNDAAIRAYLRETEGKISDLRASAARITGANSAGNDDINEEKIEEMRAELAQMSECAAGGGESLDELRAHVIVLRKALSGVTAEQIEEARRELAELDGERADEHIIEELSAKLQERIGRMDELNGKISELNSAIAANAQKLAGELATVETSLQSSRAIVEGWEVELQRVHAERDAEYRNLDQNMASLLQKKQQGDIDLQNNIIGVRARMQAVSERARGMEENARREFRPESNPKYTKLIAEAEELSRRLEEARRHEPIEQVRARAVLFRDAASEEFAEKAPEPEEMRAYRFSATCADCAENKRIIWAAHGDILKQYEAHRAAHEKRRAEAHKNLIAAEERLAVLESMERTEKELTEKLTEMRREIAALIDESDRGLTAALDGIRVTQEQDVLQLEAELAASNKQLVDMHAAVDQGMAAVREKARGVIDMLTARISELNGQIAAEKKVAEERRRGVCDEFMNADRRMKEELSVATHALEETRGAARALSSQIDEMKGRAAERKKKRGELMWVLAREQDVISLRIAEKQVRAAELREAITAGEKQLEKRRVEAQISILQKNVRDVTEGALAENTRGMEGARAGLMSLIERRERCAGIVEEAGYVEMYSACLGKNGISAMIYTKYIGAILEAMNLILDDIGVPVRVCGSDVVAGGIRMVLPGDAGVGRSVPLQSACESQKFIVSLAMRIVLSRVFPRPIPEWFIIDEGFGAMDAFNREKSREYLGRIKKQFPLLMIVTHIPELQSAIDVPLLISRDERGRSRLIYS